MSLVSMVVLLQISANNTDEALLMLDCLITQLVQKCILCT